MNVGLERILKELDVDIFYGTIPAFAWSDRKSGESLKRIRSYIKVQLLSHLTLLE
jgi:hypothetical protein